MNALAEKERQVEALILRNQRHEAIQELYRLVVSHAKAKNFQKAESLRERMLDVDEMALSEIIAAGDIIEREKTQAIDKTHQDIWHDLYGRLNQEEQNALYFATAQETCEPGEVLFHQGGRNTALYLMDRGEMKLVYTDGARETLVKTIRAGEIAGADTFYRTSLCTTSLIALSPGVYHKLDRGALTKLEETQPGLGPKLRDFCLKFSSESEVLKAKGLNRRVHKRITTEGSLVFQVLSSVGKPVSAKLIKGQMADISAGGLSFYLKTANDQNVRQLLGRRVAMKFILPRARNSQPVMQRGQVTGVLSHLSNDYSIHVKFDSLLDPHQFS